MAGGWQSWVRLLTALARVQGCLQGMSRGCWAPLYEAVRLKLTCMAELCTPASQQAQRRPWMSPSTLDEVLVRNCWRAVPDLDKPAWVQLMRSVH